MYVSSPLPSVERRNFGEGRGEGGLVKHSTDCTGEWLGYRLHRLYRVVWLYTLQIVQEGGLVIHSTDCTGWPGYTLYRLYTSILGRPASQPRHFIFLDLETFGVSLKQILDFA